MSEILIMSQRERDRLKLVVQVHQGTMTVAEASTTLNLSQRQLYRLLQRYRAEGDRGVIHRLRGRPSNRGYPRELRKKVVSLYWRQYRDYGPTLFSEMLVEYHNIALDHETVRRWLAAAGGANIQRKKRPHRRKRPRRAAIGELVQFDGSHHDWFEGRGPACCLLHAIDDASGHTFLRFVPSENAADVMRTLRLYFERYGLPRAIYTDKSSVFYAHHRLTDVGRALKTLNIELIVAHSPQAKGRVERGNRTHQDRLIKALRREDIATIAQANEFLDGVYLDKHNNLFASCDHLPDVHRPIDGLDLTNILSFQTERRVRNDYTIMLDGRYLQLERGKAPLPPPGHYVTVRRWLDDSLHVISAGHELSFTILRSPPSPKPRTPHKPSPTHPWKLKNFLLGNKSETKLDFSINKSKYCPP
jgi:transposase